MIDGLFLLALFAVGLGLSLATYRHIATHYGWPMGAVHVSQPLIPITIGTVALLLGVAFAATRATEGGWIILGCGLLLAAFWTGFLRVGSQIALFLAPAAALLLVLGWLGSV